MPAQHVLHNVILYVRMVYLYREVLTLSDGGEVALDWGVMTDATTHLGSGEDRNLPVLLILPGLTGSSTGTIAMHLSLDGIATGYRPVVFNQRGNGGIKLKVILSINHLNF